MSNILRDLYYDEDEPGWVWDILCDLLPHTADDYLHPGVLND